MGLFLASPAWRDSSIEGDAIIALAHSPPKIVPQERRLCHCEAMEQKLRFATDEDLAVVQEIVRVAYFHYVARIGREPGPMLDDYAALIGDSRVHVVERAGVVQGFLVLIPQDKAMLLDNVAVAPEAQGQGVGRLLMEFAERAAVAAGYSAINLYTNEMMVGNILLYARIGYAETHRIEEKGLKRVYMSKALTP